MLVCGEDCAGLIVNIATIIPQTDKALGILLAVNFCIRNRFLNIDFRLGFGVNECHPLFAPVAPFDCALRLLDKIVPITLQPCFSFAKKRQRTVYLRRLVAPAQIVCTFTPSEGRVLSVRRHGRSLDATHVRDLID